MKTVQTTLLSTVAAALTIGAIAYGVVAGTPAAPRSGDVVLTQDGRMRMTVTAQREAPAARRQDVSHAPAPLAKDAASI